MLILKRKLGEFVAIEPAEGTDVSLTIEDLFADGCIEVHVLEVGTKRVTLAIEAPAELKIWRRQEREGHPPKPRDRNVA